MMNTRNAEESGNEEVHRTKNSSSGGSKNPYEWDDDVMEARYRNFLELSGLLEDFTTHPEDDSCNEHSEISSESSEGEETTEDSDTDLREASGRMSNLSAVSDVVTIVNEIKRQKTAHDGSISYSSQSCSQARGQFVCPFAKCKKRFAYRTGLRRHLKCHNDLSRPFKCDDCLMRFNTKKGLKSHLSMRHKSTTKRRQANIISRALNYHSLVSSRNLSSQYQPAGSNAMPNLKKYKCKDCSLSYIGLLSLRNHYKKKHPNSAHCKQFLEALPTKMSCPICHKLFGQPRQQRRHLSSHSDIQLKAFVNGNRARICVKELVIAVETEDDDDNNVSVND